MNILYHTSLLRSKESTLYALTYIDYHSSPVVLVQQLPHYQA